MTQGREPPVGGDPFGLFGNIGDEIAGNAKALIGYLSEEPEPVVLGAMEMPASDKVAFSEWIGMEWLIPIMDVPNEPLGGGVIRRQAHDAVVAFHSALPYHEAERQWLDRTGMGHEGELSSYIQGQEERVMVAGVRRVASGRELVHRWILWRREAGPFAGQDSVAEACAALQRIQNMMSRDFH